MGVERFEVLVRDQTIGQELKREWTRPELLKGMAWLKRMNARGSEVFIRPAGQHGLVLLDALSAEALAAMRRKGFEPAAVIESNPGEYQAWIALSARPVAEQVRQFAAEGLARGFNGTVPDLAGNGFGHIAGFTIGDATRDCKMKRRFVLAREGHSTIASNGEKLVTQIANALSALQVERDRRTTIRAQQNGKGQGRGR
jgi:hypothetical protein